MYNIFMYIIELISKLIKAKRDKKLNKQKNDSISPEIDY